MLIAPITVNEARKKHQREQQKLPDISQEEARNLIEQRRKQTEGLVPPWLFSRLGIDVFPVLGDPDKYSIAYCRTCQASWKDCFIRGPKCPNPVGSLIAVWSRQYGVIQVVVDSLTEQSALKKKARIKDQEKAAAKVIAKALSKKKKAHVEETDWAQPRRDVWSAITAAESFKKQTQQLVGALDETERLQKLEDRLDDFDDLDNRIVITAVREIFSEVYKSKTGSTRPGKRCKQIVTN